MNPPFVSPRRHFENATVSERRVVEFPYYGFLSGFTVHLKEPQPNMNAGLGPWRAIITLIGPQGETPDFEVVAEFREVSTAEEARR